jgi:hypothetical protein
VGLPVASPFGWPLASVASPSFAHVCTLESVTVLVAVCDFSFPYSDARAIFIWGSVLMGRETSRDGA